MQLSMISAMGWFWGLLAWGCAVVLFLCGIGLGCCAVVAIINKIKGGRDGAQKQSIHNTSTKTDYSPRVRV